MRVEGGAELVQPVCGCEQECCLSAGGFQHPVGRRPQCPAADVGRQLRRSEESTAGLPQLGAVPSDRLAAAAGRPLRRTRQSSGTLPNAQRLSEELCGVLAHRAPLGLGGTRQVFGDVDRHPDQHRLALPAPLRAPGGDAQSLMLTYIDPVSGLVMCRDSRAGQPEKSARTLRSPWLSQPRNTSDERSPLGPDVHPARSTVYGSSGLPCLTGLLG